MVLMLFITRPCVPFVHTGVYLEEFDGNRVYIYCDQLGEWWYGGFRANGLILVAMAKLRMSQTKTSKRAG